MAINQSLVLGGGARGRNDATAKNQRFGVVQPPVATDGVLRRPEGEMSNLLQVPERSVLGDRISEPDAVEFRRCSGVFGQFTYFAWSKMHRLVKVGRSNDPWRRLDELRLSCADIELVALRRCGTFESAYHRAFAEHAAGREWFHMSPEIVGEIAWINNPARIDPSLLIESAFLESCGVPRGMSHQMGAA